MKIQDAHKGILEMFDLHVKSFSFEREKLIDNSELEISLDYKMEERSDKEAEFELSMSLNNKQNQFRLSISVVATMEKNEVSPNWNSLQSNGFAIISPFLRSQISILTAQPNFTPIVLPVFNFNKIIENQED